MQATRPVRTTRRFVRVHRTRRFARGTSANQGSLRSSRYKSRGLVMTIFTSKWPKLDISLALSLQTQRRHSHCFDKKHTATVQYPRAIQNTGQIPRTLHFPSVNSPTRTDIIWLTPELRSGIAIYTLLETNKPAGSKQLLVNDNFAYQTTSRNAHGTDGPSYSHPLL